jgi:SAM-dependent methyltransferase
VTELPSRSSANGGYDPSYFARLFAIEDRHFWFRARNRVIAKVVSQITVGLPPGYRVLEVGSGSGNVLRILQQACPHGMVVGMDLFADSFQYARQRCSCSLVQGDMLKPPFASNFQLIGVFDVLEHLPDDMQALRDLHSMLTIRGALLLTVPIHPSLWSYFDEASCHCRRYEPDELERKLIDAGFQVEYLTPYMSTILPLVWLRRRLVALVNRGRAADPRRVHELAASELRVTPVVNELMGWLLGLEARSIARRRRLRIGTSLLAVARKTAVQIKYG